MTYKAVCWFLDGEQEKPTAGFYNGPWKTSQLFSRGTLNLVVIVCLHKRLTLKRIRPGATQWGGRDKATALEGSQFLCNKAVHTCVQTNKTAQGKKPVE